MGDGNLQGMDNGQWKVRAVGDAREGMSMARGAQHRTTPLMRRPKRRSFRLLTAEVELRRASGKTSDVPCRSATKSWWCGSRGQEDWMLRGDGGDWMNGQECGLGNSDRSAGKECGLFEVSIILYAEYVMGSLQVCLRYRRGSSTSSFQGVTFEPKVWNQVPTPCVRVFMQLYSSFDAFDSFMSRS